MGRHGRPADQPEEGFEALTRELETARRELAAFEARYREAVGERPADAPFGRSPSPCRGEPPEPVRAEPEPEVWPSPELKPLYRRLARLLHPDLADDPSELAERTRRMAEANALYERLDLAGLRRLHEQLRREGGAGYMSSKLPARPGSVEELRAQLASIHASPGWRLKVHVEALAAGGRDVLDELLRRRTARSR